nr:hypothetical protein [Govania unica]
MSGDGSEQLELVEEALDQITLAIDLGAESEITLAIALRRDIGPSASVLISAPRSNMKTVYRPILIAISNLR